MPIVHRVTIVGLGLIGGSLGMALRRQRLAREVVGLSRSMANVARAKRRGAIDWGTTDPRRAVGDADLVVLAGPVDTIVPQGRRLARLMRPGRILTDVGSVKGRIVAGLDGRVSNRVAFVGAHPLAGSERRGIETADAGLFRNAVVILTPTARAPRHALTRVARLWRQLGCRVVTMSPQAHDRALAGMSHLPHLLAAGLVNAVAPARNSLAAPSFLEMTRIAASDPDLWDDILLANRGEVLAAMGRFEREWRALRRAIGAGRRPALRRHLARAQALRLRLRDAA
jgi:prephenate dehydrogenase